jgi:hypothetical protein
MAGHTNHRVVKTVPFSVAQDVTPDQPLLEWPFPEGEWVQDRPEQEVKEHCGHIRGCSTGGDEELDFSGTSFENDILKDQEDLEMVKEASRTMCTTLYVSTCNPQSSSVVLLYASLILSRQALEKRAHAMVDMVKDVDGPLCSSVGAFVRSADLSTAPPTPSLGRWTSLQLRQRTSLQDTLMPVTHLPDVFFRQLEAHPLYTRWFYSSFYDRCAPFTTY